MPIINLKMAKGRSPKQKQQFVKAVTECAVKYLDVQPEWVNIIIDEYDRDNWATNGQLHSIKYGQGYGKDGVDE